MDEVTAGDWFAARGIRRTDGGLMLLDVPDVRQDRDHTCGAAALAALLSFHGLKPARWIGRLANPDRGMQPDTVEAILHDAFGRPPLRGSMTLADLKHLTGTGRPVLCCIMTDVDGGPVGHWVVIRGVGRGRVYYQCPTHGPESERVADWLAGWRDEPESSPYQRFGVCGWPDKC